MLLTAVLVRHAPLRASFGDPQEQERRGIANLRAGQSILGSVTFLLSLLFAWIALRDGIFPLTAPRALFMVPLLLFFAAADLAMVSAYRGYRRETAQP